VQMTQMPQMVALYNGVGGGAVALIAWSELRHGISLHEAIPLDTLIPVLFAAVIAALALAAGLAFGLGGRDVASRIWRQSARTISTQASTPQPPVTVSTVKTPTPIESGRQN